MFYDPHHHCSSFASHLYVMLPKYANLTVRGEDRMEVSKERAQKVKLYPLIDGVRRRTPEKTIDQYFTVSSWISVFLSSYPSQHRKTSSPPLPASSQAKTPAPTSTLRDGGCGPLRSISGLEGWTGTLVVSTITIVGTTRVPC